MGIPKFFRFISERWPLISWKIDDSQVPEFDNLYLDMNSILHNCTHSNDGSITSMTDDQMFGAIFAYIDHLFHTIKPQKTFYMAIDGVAPRAKMNQQRARRFRTAVEAEENMAKAIKEGKEIPKDPPFDSNSITPGTEFMAKLTKNLKFYINQKVSNDTNWQNVNVILSGHEVPGEGEHKIMHFIRTQKSQPEYNPNTRHCIYGLDADLIMLGLVSHEPHMAILREEVTFGPQASAPSSDLTKQNIYLLHISLVREYLALEFQELEDQVSFDYDFERVLDDFILIMYVIGNDFLPNLPDLHINKGAFPLLIETFKQAMRDTDGYLNEYGTINLKRLAIWLEFLSVFEYENFEKGEVDVEWFNKQLDNISRKGAQKRKRQGKELLVKQQKKLVGSVREWIYNVYSKQFSLEEMQQDESKIPQLPLPKEFIDSGLNKEFLGRFMFDLGLIVIHSNSKDTYTAKLDIDGIDPHETPEEFETRRDDVRKVIKKYQSAVIVEDEETLEDQKDMYDAKFLKWKNQYYKSKFDFTLDDEEEIVALTENYIEGLQWVLYYYYTGICSWPWYFKYHYAPRISDIRKGLNVKINFEKGTPFKPYQQLMAVLPARSKELIPIPYRTLMTDPASSIIDFYPANCDIDMNGKKASWEAVVLLSFVDEARLIEAMEPYDAMLTPEEKQRNSFGSDLLFHFNPQVKSIIHSPLPASFADFESHCIETVYEFPSMEGLAIKLSLCESAKLGKELLAGFPSLKSIPVKDVNLEYANITIFQQPSRGQSLVLRLENVHASLTVEQFAKEYVDQIVYTNWPFLRESKVVAVTDNLMKYEMARFGSVKKVVSGPLEGFEIDEFEKTRRLIFQKLKSNRGVQLEISGEEADERSSTDSDEDDLSSKRKGNKEEKNPIEGLVYVRPVTGLIRTPEGAFVKTLSKNVEVFPIQLVVDEIINKDERFKERPPIPVEEEFPIGSNVVFLGTFAYGTPASVIGHQAGKLTLKVTKISNTKEPNFGTAAAVHEKQAIAYHPSTQVARILGFSPLFLSKITSSYMIEIPGGKKMNVGLQLKFEGKKLKVMGYSKKNDRFWEFSDLAINLLQEYTKNFPQLFRALVNYKSNAIPSAKELFKISDPEKLKVQLDAIKAFLKAKQSSFLTVSLDSDSLSKLGIRDVEENIINYSLQPQQFKSSGLNGIPISAVLDPVSTPQLLKKQVFALGDRVVYILDSGKVPMFSKGTVIGIRSLDSKVSLQVLFDQPLLTGNTFDGRLKTQRGLTVTSSSLLNLTNPQLRYHSKASATYSKGGSLPDAHKKILMKKKSEKERIAKEKAEQEKIDKENLVKSQKEILSLIKKSSKVDSKDEDKPAESEETNKSESTSTSTCALSGKAAAKDIYDQIIGNVISPSSQQQPQQQLMPQYMVSGPQMGFPVGQQYPMFYPPPPPFMQQIPVNMNGSQQLMGMLQPQPIPVQEQPISQQEGPKASGGNNNQTKTGPKPEVKTNENKTRRGGKKHKKPVSASDSKSDSAPGTSTTPSSAT